MTVALVDDLMFGSKIRSACKAAAEAVSIVRQPDRAIALARADPDPTSVLVILDLDREALDPMRVLAELRSDGALAGIRIAAFVRHTSTDRIVAARTAGADVVLARSAFFATLPDILAGRGRAQPSSVPDGAS